VREASLYALADTLVGRTWAEVEDILADLWTRVFKLLDDRKQSVCKAALSACKALSALTVRLCDPTHTTAAVSSRVLANALPLFIQYGLQSGAEEVKQFASAQLLAVVSACGELLGEHVCALVPPLLDGLAELEPQQLTYLTFHAERLGVNRRQLDESRVAASRASPLAKTLDLCVRHVHNDNCRALAKALANTLTRGVGLQTRAGAARFVEMVAVEHPAVARTISPLLVRTLSSVCLQVGLEDGYRREREREREKERERERGKERERERESVYMWVWVCVLYMYESSRNETKRN
jgi:proteasome component ECM29